MSRKIGGMAGIVGTVLFTLSFTVNGALRADYDPLRRYVSELSIGPQGWIQIVSFVVLGLSLMVFALGVSAALYGGRVARAAPMLLLVVGVSYVLSGPFVTDPQAMFDNQQTAHGVIHGIVGALVFSLSAAGCFVLWRRFRTDDAWRSLSGFSLTAGIVMAALIVCMKIGQLQSGPLHDLAGLVQRCCLITSYAWICLISARMLKTG